MPGWFSGDSPLVRDICAGAPVAVEKYQIVDWQITDGQKTMRG